MLGKDHPPFKPPLTVHLPTPGLWLGSAVNQTVAACLHQPRRRSGHACQMSGLCSLPPYGSCPGKPPTDKPFLKCYSRASQVLTVTVTLSLKDDVTANSSFQTWTGTGCRAGVSFRLTLSSRHTSSSSSLGTVPLTTSVQ